MFPDRTSEIQFHKENARNYFRQGNFDMARLSYFKWVESIRQQNINTNGNLENEYNSAQKEYSDFVKNDPLYKNICDQIIPKIKENPGILQTDLYKLFPNIEKSDITYTLFFADDHGIVNRVKKGRTYELTI